MDACAPLPATPSLCAPSNSTAHGRSTVRARRTTANRTRWAPGCFHDRRPLGSVLCVRVDCTAASLDSEGSRKPPVATWGAPQEKDQLPRRNEPTRGAQGSGFVDRSSGSGTGRKTHALRSHAGACHGRPLVDRLPVASQRAPINRFRPVSQRIQPRGSRPCAVADPSLNLF